MTKRKRRRIPKAEPGRIDPPKPSKTGCVCKNHKGGPKVQHKTKVAALGMQIARARGGGEWVTYPCPSSDRWHVAQVRGPQ